MAQPKQKDWRGGALVFSPMAWLHWQFLCRGGSTEACAFGVSAEDDWLYVERLIVPKQECTSVTCVPDEHELSEAMMDLSVQELNPHRVCHIWLHTHPEMSANPSGTDEETFNKVFGQVSDLQWVVMGILSRTGDTYARIQYRQTMAQHRLPIEIDWKSLPEKSDEIAGEMTKWRAEYNDKIREKRVSYISNISHLYGYGYGNDFEVGGFASVTTARAEDTGKIIRPDPEPELTKDEAVQKFTSWLKEKYGLDSLAPYDEDTRDELLDEFEEETGIILPDEEEDEPPPHWYDLDQDGLYHP